MKLSEQARNAAPVSTDETVNTKLAGGEANKGKFRCSINLGYLD